jgi:uncharacterized protein
MNSTTTMAKNRLVTVDALRGFALLGIMLAHFIFWHTAGPLPETVYAQHKDIGSSVARFFTDIFISGKFFAFFSFLFGLSFYLQTGEGNGNVVRRFAWRITILLFIGLVHHAFWQGDILSIYAPLGFLLLVGRRLSNRWVLALGLLLVMNLPGKIIGLVQLLSHPTPGGGNFGDFAATATEYDKLIETGSWLQIIKYNLLHLSTKFNFQIESGRLYMTMGFFLLGLFVGRMKWFEKGVEARAVWRRLCKRSAVIGGVCLVIGLGLIISNEVLKLKLEQSQTVGYFFSYLLDAFSAAMVVFYVSGLALLMFRRRWQSFFYSLAPVGKMALTSYLTQTIFGLLFFWGVGFGFYTKTSPGGNYLIAIGFFVLQVYFSKWWLKAFYYGPVEWLWRSATLLKMQPMIRRAKTTAQENMFSKTIKETAEISQ